MAHENIVQIQPFLLRPAGMSLIKTNLWTN